MENFGKYIIERSIGKGATANVYLARDSALNIDVALKIMNEQSFNGSIDLKKIFIDEAPRIAALNHQNIIKVYDVKEIENRAYIAMEYLAGGTLEERIKDGRSFDPNKVVMEIANALHYAYSNHGIIHRDLKPANILFRLHPDSSIDAVLTDFGISKTQGIDSDFTEINVNVGTPRYMSPEQLMQGAIDNRSDLYTLGIIYYEMLSGEKLHLDDKIRSLAPKLPDATKEQQEIINKLITPHPDDRYKNAKELIEDIKLLQGKKPKKSSVLSNKITKSMVVKAAMPVGIIFSLGISYLYYENNSSNERKLDSSLVELQALYDNAENSKESNDIDATENLATSIAAEHPNNQRALKIIEQLSSLKEDIALETKLKSINRLIDNKSYHEAKIQADNLLRNENIPAEITQRTEALLARIEKSQTDQLLGKLTLNTTPKRSPTNPERESLPRINISISNSVYLHCVYETPQSKELYRIFPVPEKLADAFDHLRPYIDYQALPNNSSLAIPYGDNEVGTANIYCFTTLEPQKEFMSFFQDTEFSPIKKSVNLNNVMNLFKEKSHLARESTLEFY